MRGIMLARSRVTKETSASGATSGRSSARTVSLSMLANARCGLKPRNIGRKLGSRKREIARNAREGFDPGHFALAHLRHCGDANDLACRIAFRDRRQAVALAGGRPVANAAPEGWIRPVPGWQQSGLRRQEPRKRPLPSGPRHISRSKSYHLANARTPGCDRNQCSGRRPPIAAARCRDRLRRTSAYASRAPFPLSNSSVPCLRAVPARTAAPTTLDPAEPMHSNSRPTPDAQSPTPLPPRYFFCADRILR